MQWALEQALWSLSSADWASLVAQEGRHSSVQRGVSRKVGLEPGLGRVLRFPGNPGGGGEIGRAQQAEGLLGVQHTCRRCRSCPWCVHGLVRPAGRSFVVGAMSSGALATQQWAGLHSVPAFTYSVQVGAFFCFVFT